MQIEFFNNILIWELSFFVLVNVIWIAIYFKFRKRENLINGLKEQPFVSVVIPVFNKAKYIRGTITSALNLDYKNKEIIVVNDGSTDRSESICREFEKKGLIKFLRFRKNCGKAKALNAGIKASNADFILTLDADSFIKRDALSLMIRRFSDPKLGAVAGVVKVKNKKGVLPHLQFIEYFQQAFQRLIQGFFQSVLVLPGPISLYRKEAIVRSGYFEKTTLAEDWDMTLKVHKSGYGVISDKKASATTYTPKGVKEWWHQRVRWSRGGIQIAQKHKDIFIKTKNKVMKRFVFPLHIVWIFVPIIAMPLALILMLPTPVAFIEFFNSIGVFFGTLFGWVFAGIQTTVVGLYSMMDVAIFNFLELNNFGLLKTLAMLTGFAFMSFTYFAIKSFKKDFTPKNLIMLLIMPVYWIMLNAVFLYSLALEVLKRKAVW